MISKRKEISQLRPTVINFPQTEGVVKPLQLANRHSIQRLMVEHPDTYAVFYDDQGEPVVLLNPDNPGDKKCFNGIAITEYGVAVWSREPAVGGGHDRSHIETPVVRTDGVNYDLFHHNISGVILEVFQRGGSFDFRSVGGTATSIHTDVSTELKEHTAFTQSIPQSMYRKS